MSQKKTDFANCAGGVYLRIIVCIATLILVGAFIAVVLRTFEQRKLENDRKALAISEYGLFVALQKIKDSPSWNEGIPREPYDGGEYEVSVEKKIQADTLLLNIKSMGKMGSVEKMKECTLRLEIKENDSVWVQQSMQ